MNRARDRFDRLLCQEQPGRGGKLVCGRPIGGVTGLDELLNLRAHLAEHHDRSIDTNAALELRASWERCEDLVRRIESLGYSVLFVEYCEDARTPGLLGQIAGVTDRELREVKVRLKGRTAGEIVETLEHELRHVEDPDWDCGNRDVLGRGGPGSAA